MAAMAQAAAPDRSLRPEPRPTVTKPAPSHAVFLDKAPGLKASLRPVARPARLSGNRQILESVQPTTPEPARRGICGNRRIKGSRADPVLGRLKGCGILNPVRITEVEGVQLSRPATIDCPTALALADWVRNGVKPAIGNQGRGLAVIDVIGSYSCRTRNSRPGAKISEHGRGRAIDIAGFRLADGTHISVLKGWRDRRTSKLLRRIHALACGRFGTVLGPNSDQYHQDHFHLDTANYRNGAYCR